MHGRTPVNLRRFSYLRTCGDDHLGLVEQLATDDSEPQPQIREEFASCTRAQRRQNDPSLGTLVWRPIHHFVSARTGRYPTTTRAVQIVGSVDATLNTSLATVGIFL